MANKDDTLTPDDAIEVLEELLPAQNESYALGLKFKLPQSDVQGIHDTYSKPRNRLLQILIEFFIIKQTDPKPSWRVIVEALRSRAVNQSALATTVESARPHHREAATVESARPLHLEEAVETDQSMEEVRSRVLAFRQRFNVIKQATIQRLIACQITVASTVFWLTSIRALAEHKVFLEGNLNALGQCPDHWILFGKLNFYWNYLAYDLLHQLLEVLTTQFREFRTNSEVIAEYKKDLEEFKRNTPLNVFCKAEPMPFSEQDTPPPGFQEMVGEFNWSENVTLEEVEQFQKRYAREYNLEDCAMMVNSIRPGSFVVTWFIPVSIARLLSQETDRAVNLFVEFEVTRLEIAGNCVYHSSFQKVAPSLPSFTNETSTERTKLTLLSQNSVESQEIKLYEVHNQLIRRNELIRTGEDVVKHEQEIQQLLERYKAVEELYKKQEDNLTAKINVDLSQEMPHLQSQKTAAEDEKQQLMMELSRLERNLRLARERYERTEQLRMGRNAAATAVAVAVIGVCLIPFTAGIGVVIAASAVAGVGGVVVVSRAASRREMDRIEGEMNETKSRINNCESNIHSLSNKITQLDDEIQQHQLEQIRVHEARGEIKEMIVFLMDAQMFVKRYKKAIENCSTQTELVKKLDDEVEKKEYSLIDCKGTKIVVSSFNKAWVLFREMREHVQSGIDCPKCSSHCNELPYVRSGQMVCATCFNL